MPTLRFPSSLVGTVALSWVVLAQPSWPMRPGNWETTVELHIPNAPISMPPMTTNRCLTAEDLRDPQSALPTQPSGPGGAGANGCTISDFTIVGHEIRWKMSCSTGQMDGSGTMTVTGDTYEGTVNMSTPQGDMSVDLTGKRLGDC